MLPGDVLRVAGGVDGADGVCTAVQTEAKGLCCVDGELRFTQAGFAAAEAGVLTVASRFGNLYTPAAGDVVVGTVLDKAPDGYSVDIRAATPGFLAGLAFNGATKRSAPALAPGDAVLCRVALCGLGVQTALTCRDERDERSELGPLADGLVLRQPASETLCLLEDRGVLSRLSRLVRFRVAFGLNGALWVGAASAFDTVTCRLCLTDPQAMEEVAGQRARLRRAAGPRALQTPQTPQARE